MEQEIISAVQATVDKGVAARSVPFDWQGERYWIKIALNNQENGWHRLQNGAAALLGVALLRATVSDAGDPGLMNECRRLKRLREKGALVPTVITQQPGWILLSDVGESLYGCVKKSDNPQKLILEGARALGSLHQKGAWHGTGQLRDLTFNGQEIGFIDFEENVGEAMSLAAAQARDILRYLISCVKFDPDDGSLMRETMAAYAEIAPAHVWPHITKLMTLLSPFAVLLRPFAGKLGRDLRHSLMVYNAIKATVRQL